LAISPPMSDASRSVATRLRACTGRSSSVIYLLQPINATE
jgi:hypothetical protein